MRLKELETIWDDYEVYEKSDPADRQYIEQVPSRKARTKKQKEAHG